MTGPYNDIIHLPHPNSAKHPRMPIQDRAAIFSPFAALSGHSAAIAETARLTDQRMELDEDTKMELDLKQQVLRSPSVCEERGFSSPLARTLGVRYVSGNLLVDEKGIIIKRDVPMDALDRTLADWLDKK